jgi:hypothetical protein
MSHFLHVYIEPKPGTTRRDVEATLNKGLDWFRYHKNVYIVYTVCDAQTWHNRLKTHVVPGGELFISELDITKRSGFMVDEFWKWLWKPRK